MSKKSTAQKNEVAREIEDDEDFDFEPPPLLKATLSSVWAAYDTAIAADLDSEIVESLDDVIHLVLDQIDGLMISEMRARGMLEPEKMIPWATVKAELDAKNSSLESERVEERKTPDAKTPDAKTPDAKKPLIKTRVAKKSESQKSQRVKVAA